MTSVQGKRRLSAEKGRGAVKRLDRAGDSEVEEDSDSEEKGRRRDEIFRKRQGKERYISQNALGSRPQLAFLLQSHSHPRSQPYIQESASSQPSGGSPTLFPKPSTAATLTNTTPESPGATVTYRLRS